MPRFCRYVAPGNVVDIIPGGNVTAGEVVVNGTRPLIISKTATGATTQNTASVEGVWDVPKVNGIINAGTLIYWDENGNPQGGAPATGAATVTPAVGRLLGVATPMQPNGLAATAANDEFVRVKLAGISVNITTLAGAVNLDAVTGLQNPLPITGLAPAGAGAGGAVTVTGGAANTDGAGGAVGLVGGLGLLAGAGGAVSMVGGVGGATNGNGGAASVTGGAATANGTGGAVTITSGASAAVGGTAGSIAIDCGAAAGGTAGTITIGGANASAVTITAPLTVGNSVRAAGTTFTPFIPHGADAAAVAPADAIPITNYYSKLDSNAGPTTQTLADGAVIGQLKKIQMIVAGNNDVVTPTNLSGFATITFDAVGQYVVLVWDGTNWVVIELGSAADGSGDGPALA